MHSLAPRHEGVWASGGIAPCSTNFRTKWSISSKYSVSGLRKKTNLLLLHYLSVWRDRRKTRQVVISLSCLETVRIPSTCKSGLLIAWPLCLGFLQPALDSGARTENLKDINFNRKSHKHVIQFSSNRKLFFIFLL
jgi:hypothetical protein